MCEERGRHANREPIVILIDTSQTVGAANYSIFSVFSILSGVPVTLLSNHLGYF